jgi:hypothetical protein
MGKEMQGAVRVGRERHQGKILLETSELIFRGTDYRFEIAFGEMRSVKAASGELRIETKDGVSVFEVGTQAEKWRKKILHPKTRVQKLGVKGGTKVRLLGEFPSDFVNELKAARAEIIQAGSSANADHNFFAAERQTSLATIAKYAKKLKDTEALWVVYEKAKKDPAEIDVIAAGRKAELKDVKVVGFSSTHTALKFVLPLEKR